ncbi:MAG: thioredoxin-disulfide reductase [bacterium]|nr:thioredoxin-disulfide reductase [bacterium]
MENVVIVGTGPAGYTAAIYCARADLKPIIISGELPGGLLTQTTDIENFPGFPEAVNGFELMDKMQKQAESFGTTLKYDSVESVEFKNGGPQILKLESGEEITAKAVIIATGSSPRWMGLESEKRLQTKGVSACATCDGAFYRDVPVVVVGGGDSAMEEAMFLTKFASKVTVVHRRDELRASKIMATRALANKKIEFAWNSTVVEVLGADKVEGVKIKNVKSGEESIIECDGYFAALGHVPNTQVFTSAVKADDKGFILLKDQSSYTDIEGVFAAGDCADNTYKQAISAAGMGCRAAIDAERWLEGLS